MEIKEAKENTAVKLAQSLPAPNDNVANALVVTGWMRDLVGREERHSPALIDEAIALACHREPKQKAVGLLRAFNPAIKYDEQKVILMRGSAVGTRGKKKTVGVPGVTMVLKGYFKTLADGEPRPADSSPGFSSYLPSGSQGAVLRWLNNGVAILVCHKEPGMEPGKPLSGDAQRALTDLDTYAGKLGLTAKPDAVEPALAPVATIPAKPSEDASAAPKKKKA